MDTDSSNLEEKRLENNDYPQLTEKKEPLVPVAIKKQNKCI